MFLRISWSMMPGLSVAWLVWWQAAWLTPGLAHAAPHLSSTLLVSSSIVSSSIVSSSIGAETQSAGGDPPAQDASPAQIPQLPNQTPKSAPVSAIVGGVEITMQDVRRELVISTRGRKIAAEARPALEASALEKLVNRELALLYFKTTEHYANDTEVAQHWDRLKKRLEARSIDPQKHLREKGFRDLNHWRHEARWELSWLSFLKNYTTDEYLEKYFMRHQRHFDGSEVRAAHILWKTPNAKSLIRARQEAKRVRELIAKGEVTFEAAAKKYSQSPTAADAGDIGFLDRRRTMPESFSKAAFDLKIGEISQPVSTRFGVHLIRILEVKPGKTTWRDAREELTRSVARWLFQWAADKLRANTKVKYTGVTPYWRDDPDGRRLVDVLGE